MLKYSRVSRVLDTNRLALAVSRPGIDPRSWAYLAIITDIFIDPEHGPMADLALMPMGENATARIASPVAGCAQQSSGGPVSGGGFGFYAPMRVDDEVIVLAPGGDTTALVIIGHLWSPADPPPSEMVSTPAQMLLQAPLDTDNKIKTTGTGANRITSETGNVELTSSGADVVLTPGGSNNVRLGASGAAHPVIQGDSFLTAQQAFDIALVAVLNTCVPPPTGMTGFGNAIKAYETAISNAYSANVKVD